MILRTVLCGLAFISAASVAASAHAESPGAACFAQHEPARVQPHRVEKWAGQGPHLALAGARVFFWAEPGMTGEWLYHQLAQRLAEGHATNECPLDVPGVRIRVRSAGPGFWLEITASEGNRAGEVLRRAQVLVPK